MLINAFPVDCSFRCLVTVKTVVAEDATMPRLKSLSQSGSPRHFVREWRKHRQLTLEALAGQIGVTHGALSQLERGETAYTQSMLEALADALECTPSDLISRSPDAASNSPAVGSPVRWYLREWRKHLHLTQGQVAERIGTAVAVVSQLETGHRQMNDKWVAAFAGTFDIEHSDLLRPPDALPNLRIVEEQRLASMWEEASPEDRERIYRVIEALIAKPTQNTTQ